MDQKLKDFLKHCKYNYAELSELNFHEVVKNKSEVLDAILPMGEIAFTLFKVDGVGCFVISRNPPEVRAFHRYRKKWYITSTDSFL